MTDPLVASEDGLSGAEVMAQRNAFRNSFAADKWVPWLQGETFDSVFVPVSYAQGERKLDHVHDGSSSTAHAKEQELNEDELAAWNDLVEKLEAARSTFGADNFFAKLGTRSGKDAVLYGFRELQLREEFGARLKKMKVRSAEADGQAFIAAQTLAMRLSTVADALEMFAWSFRISADLAAEQSAGEQKFSMNVVLRRWNDDVVERTQWEFRGFVSNCKLTAITQYFSICYFEELSKNQDAICKKLVEYHDRIRQRIQPHLTSYGIDFFIASDGRVLTIELNPFYTSLGAGLFDWKVRLSATFDERHGIMCTTTHQIARAARAYFHLSQDDFKLLTEGCGDTTVIRVLHQKSGAEHDAYEWLPLRWFKWLHATHPCAASREWALSQGLEMEVKDGLRNELEGEEKNGNGACIIT